MLSLENKCEILLSKIGVADPFVLKRFADGKNNQTFHVKMSNASYVLKCFFLDKNSARNRLESEYLFLQYCRESALKQVPMVLATDPAQAVSLLEYVPGKKILEPTKNHVFACAQFIRELNRNRLKAKLPEASDTCFSLQGHLALIGDRLARVATVSPTDELDKQMLDFVNAELAPIWEQIKQRPVPSGLDTIKESSRCISPSDFGFHNALLTDDGRLVFLDFEYAGIDDPAKLICDYFSQVKVPVDSTYWDLFLNEAFAGFSDRDLIWARAEILLPAVRLKWICIALNVFIASIAKRRAFAESTVIDLAAQKREKLLLAATLLSQLKEEL